jgi:hypothetical protein
VNDSVIICPILSKKAIKRNGFWASLLGTSAMLKISRPAGRRETEDKTWLVLPSALIQGYYGQSHPNTPAVSSA